MTAISSLANDRASAPRLFGVMASRPLWVALAVTALITVIRLTGTVDSDVAWQLWIAGRIHAGANLYRDIVETNPPLWFWMALPVDRIASLLHVRVEAMLIVAIGALAALSLAATDRLLGDIEAKRRTLLLAYAALTMMALPWLHVGQREQLVLIGTVPYAALIAARRQDRPISPYLAALIGIGAALVFALKHYFLIVPVLLELWLLAGQRRRWRPLRAETAAIACVGLVYVVALVLLERDYLTNIVPLLRLAYADFGPPSVRYLFGPWAVVGLVTLCFLAAHARLLSHRKTPFAAALSVAALGFAAAYFIQFKGWPYHAIPFVGCASLALAALVAQTASPPLVLRVFAPALLLIPPLRAASDARNVTVPTPDLQRAISGLRRGDVIGFITEDTALPWSVTLQHGFRYASRYMGFWMLRAVILNQQGRDPDPRLELLARETVSRTVMDFRCLPPRRLIIARPARGTWTENTADILPFFTRDPDFAELLTHYRPLGRTTLDVYELKDPVAPLPASQCRRGV